MKQFCLNSGPFVRTDITNRSIMMSFIIVLIPFIMYALYINGVVPYLNGDIGFINIFYPLLFILLPICLTFLLDFIYKIIFVKNKSFKEYFGSSYAVFSSLFTGLMFSINTNIWIIVIAVFISFILYKLFFVKLHSLSILSYVIGTLIIVLLNKFNIINVFSSINLTNIYNIGDYDSLVVNNGGFDNLLFNGSGLMSPLLSMIGFIYLCVKKDVKWRITCSSLITLFVITLIIGLINGLNIWYPFYFLLTCGVLFLVCFIATDFNSPCTKGGQIAYGIIAGLLILLFRYISNVDITFMAIFVLNTFGILTDYICEFLRTKKRLCK